MKKVLALFAAGVFMFAMSSCKKDYTCECTEDDGDTYSYPIENQKKGDAETACKAFEFGDETCELK